MIRISQAHVFLEDYVHIHQMGSHFVGGYLLNFSPTGQEIPKISILQAIGPRWSYIACRRNKIKKVPNLSVLDKNAFFTEIC